MFLQVLILCFTFHALDVNVSAQKCGYSSCDIGKPNVLNVHIIPHTHDDVGWLKTVDQYYYGYKDDIQAAGVQYVIDTVVKALDEDPKRKFSYVEMAYFYRWWKEQDSAMKNKVKGLVNEGRLQFLLGGWSMNDEATTYYVGIIDQMTLGLDFLNQTFGECGRPLVSWQIDPFGHSIEQASMFYEMGFDGLYFMRLDYRDKAQRMKEKRLEFLQRTSFFHVKNLNYLFTGINYDSYCTPGGFCFDDKCSDDPIMDDDSLHDKNVQKRVDDFAKYVLSQAKAYTTNHILVPMGCDFQFQNAFHNFKNLDKLIKYVNLLRKDINVLYSTPACYTLAVNKAKQKYTEKTDDFFPYASGPNSYWTGYFTSRSALKGYVRYSNNFYQKCKQLHTLSKINEKGINFKVKQNGMKLGVLHHHDAVTGTEKQHVSYDYAQRLSEGSAGCKDVVNVSVNEILKNKFHNDFTFQVCDLLNISECSRTDNMKYNSPLMIAIYNSLGSSVSHWSRLPVTVANGDKYVVTQMPSTSLPTQLIPITNRTKQIPERSKQLSSNFELIFNVDVPPMGFAILTVNRLKSKMRSSHFPKVLQISKGETKIIKNQNLQMNYTNGLLTSVMNLKTNVQISMTQKMAFYYSAQDNGQSSGAYIFRPTTNSSVPFGGTVHTTVIEGPLVTEVYQNFSDWATLVTRLYNNSEYFETEWTVGPIPVTDKVGKEVVIDYVTNLITDKIFVTDSNGRQVVTRVVDKRLDYNFEQTEPVAGNYYPLNSDVFMFNHSAKLKRSPSIIIRPDRAEGVGSYKDGMVEVMLHRRMLRDDGFGVGEALNEVGSDGNGLIVRGKHWTSVDMLGNLMDTRRIDNLKVFNMPLTLFLNSVSGSHCDLTSFHSFSVLKSPLPKYVHILSLENHISDEWNVDYQILRLEDLRTTDEGEIVNVDLNNLFANYTISTVEELNLSANQYLKDVQRLVWYTAKNETVHHKALLNGTVVSLACGQIRTFKITLNVRK